MKRIVAIAVLSLLFQVQLFAQNASFSGTVSNSDGNPLPGAFVKFKDQLLGTVTNAKGEFNIKNIPSATYNIEVSYLGYEPAKLSLRLDGDVAQNFSLKPSAILLGQGVSINAVRAQRTTPVTYQNIEKEDIEDVNLAQDLPILLNQSVSAVTTSDAGAGVGYSGIRIRGSDATRINVTINGVPLNDPEGHGVFWVNMPDFASSANDIQIQRGVGTSTNGAAAFGASINLQTTEIDQEAYVETNQSYGSFNTRKHNIIFNSGLLNDHFNFEGRLSYIGSDGYIDRSASDLRSYYLSGGYYGEKLMVKAVTFAGHEVTQQAWWGTPESRINNDEADMLRHASYEGYSQEQTDNLLNSGRTFNYYLYDNEVDDYKQDHYQLITGYQITPKLYLNLTGHYTYGRGFFEQSKSDESFADVGLPDVMIGADTIASSDMIFRRWLDNHFYGGVYSLQYNANKLNLTLGGSYNEYLGDHFGEIIWAEYAVDQEIRQQYYFSESRKTDFAQYLKAEYALGNFTLYADAQVRAITYTTKGVDNDQRPIDVDADYVFFNPKAGASYRLNARNSFYASIAQASREPVRGDFVDAVDGVEPKPEFLSNAELGWNHSAAKWSLQANAYYMLYQDQLVLTGEVNDVGSPIRTNVDESYRAGIEIAASVKPYKGLFWMPNLTLSQNKIIGFQETIYDYTNGFDVIVNDLGTTDIAFSPSIIAGSQLGYEFDFGLRLALLSKYVGKQYLDNSSNDSKSIDPYFVNDLSISYDVPVKGLKRLTLNLLVNNILNEQYESNGYTYSYIYGEMVTENFYFPQAGTNFLAGVKLRF